MTFTVIEMVVIYALGNLLGWRLGYAAGFLAGSYGQRCKDRGQKEEAEKAFRPWPFI